MQTPYNSIESNRRWNSAEKFGNDGGELWSHAWGGTAHLWMVTLLPRLAPFLPSRNLLEIAPGFGRVSAYLEAFAENYIGVDLNEVCVEACRDRFQEKPHMSFYENDGKSLPMVGDSSVDLIFSWDSMVHVQIDALYPYFLEFARVLKPGGYGFIHHSNFRSVLEATPKERWAEVIQTKGQGRANQVSAVAVQEFCRRAGLHLISQELHTWANESLTDCISVFRKTKPTGTPPRILENHDFRDEQAIARRIAEHYGD